MKERKQKTIYKRNRSISVKALLLATVLSLSTLFAACNSGGKGGATKYPETGEPQITVTDTVHEVYVWEDVAQDCAKRNYAVQAFG